MAGRTSQASRRRGASPRGTTNSRARQPAKKAGRAAPRRRPAARPGPGPIVGQAVRALWMGMAHGVGWAFRQAGSARGLDPEQRRDGAGLLVFGLALLSAVALWFSGAGPVGARLADTVRLFLGAISVVVRCC